MINLIPATAKRRIAFEYWTRVASVCLLISTLIIITGTLLLLPVYVRINTQINAYSESVVSATEQVTKYDISSGALVKTSQQARQLLTIKDKKHFSDITTLLESLTNEQISITTFDFAREDNGIKPINIMGTATSRQALADFRKRLIENESIAEAFLPISNLTQDKDIEFNVTVTMK
jgi:hypothetical protein